MKKTLMFAALIGSVVMGAAELDLSMYKPVDPARNMAKNGGFEMFSPGKKFMYYWGRTSDFFIWDTTVKHSGKASAKLGNVPKSYTSMAINLGKIEDLKNDILIRGWLKYENISLQTRSSSPFIGFWTIDEKYKNSLTVPLIKVPEGSGDWQKFETIVKIDDFKAMCAKYPKKPTYCTFRVNIYMQPGWVWLDDVEIIPLEKK